MASRIGELFGYAPDDRSRNAEAARRSCRCPFLESSCVKIFRDKVPAGVCSLQTLGGTNVIICPHRLYYGQLTLLGDLARSLFGKVPFVPGVPIDPTSIDRLTVFALGKGSGHEIRLPGRVLRDGRRAGYFVDWILALADGGGLKEFCAVEVQTIDTTGTYRPEQEAWMRDSTFVGQSTAGFNWENVSKRILPQLIFKGHVLRREPLCSKGFHFVCPEPVHERIMDRLGNALGEIHPHSGSLSFHYYQLGPRLTDGQVREVQKQGVFTTTVDQVANAFVAPTNLPPAGVYEQAIIKALGYPST